MPRAATYERQVAVLQTQLKAQTDINRILQRSNDELQAQVIGMADDEEVSAEVKPARKKPGPKPGSRRRATVTHGRGAKGGARSGARTSSTRKPAASGSGGAPASKSTASA